VLALLYGIASVGNLIGIFSKTFLSHFHDIIGKFLPTVCDTPKISLIIRIDATLGAYPVYVTPQLPAAAFSIFVANMGDSLC
jgi:hypothetical protein